MPEGTIFCFVYTTSRNDFRVVVLPGATRFVIITIVASAVEGVGRLTVMARRPARSFMNELWHFFSITRLRLSENSFVLRLLNFCADFFCFVFVLFFLHSLERNVRINLSMQFRASFFLSLFYRMAASCKCNVTSQSGSLGAITISVFPVNTERPCLNLPSLKKTRDMRSDGPVEA